MSGYNDLETLIRSTIRANGAQQITGDGLQDVLLQMLSFSNGMEEILYEDLVTLREDSELMPSRLYRITDYVTTTSQTDTRSAGNQFDVVVLALTNDTLSERAWACHHEGDMYFQDSHLEAWQIWYSIDNDTSRFQWAVPTSEGGKGVIYRMIDEWNNDCPYDFKNILFRDSNDSSDTRFYYTFTTDNSYDYTRDLGHLCRENTIKAHVVNRSQILCSNIFKNSSAGKCSRNVLESGCLDNTFKSNCSNNRLIESRMNTFGNGFNRNIIKGDNNTFGNNCYDNVVEGMTRGNFGNSCYGNRVGSDCVNIILTSNCTFNHFGDSCTNITLGSFFRNMRFGNFVDRISFINDETASNNMQVQAYVIDANINRSGARLNLNVTRALDYTTRVAKDSSGNIKQFCIADLAQ